MRTLTPLSKLEREMIVASDEKETRIAFLEEGRLAEYYYERAQERTIVGNIYKGRVTTVLPGLQAAFVDIGLERSGFIHARDILTESLTIEDFMKAQQARKREDEGDEEESPGGYERFNRRPIQDLVKKGQEILVQVEKDSISTKGPRLTGQISVPTRLAVIIPGAEHSGVSHRIATESERSRLKSILDKATPKGFGTIARTSAEGATEEEMKAEIQYGLKIWKNLKAKEKKSKAPAVLHAEEGLLHRVARDIMTEEDGRIVIDAGHDGKRIKTWLDTFLSSLSPNIELYKGTAPVFESLNLEAEIEKALRPKVWLKCGGYLVIEETEALVVVDVNTGRNVGKTRQDDTILKTNLEAAQEIARQLRLRDLGGIVVLDFIDMRIEEHKERVYLELAQALQRDRAKTSLRQLTDLGLIEMTRKRVRGSLLRTLCEPCPMCQHRGWVRSRESTALRLQRLLEKAQRLTGEKEFILEVPPYALIFLEEAYLREQGRKVQVKLHVVGQPALKTDEMRLISPLTQVVVEGGVTGE
jgi:ribonuclease G